VETRAALGNLMQDGYDKLLIVTLPWLVRIVQGTRAAPAVHSLQLAVSGQSEGDRKGHPTAALA
jgi:hypothetical protein